MMDGIELDLCFEDGRRRRERHALPLSIGRDAASGLVLRAWRVGRRHARLLRRQDEIWIEDLGSLFGTVVNGERVAAYGPLLAHDEVVIGPCLMRVLPAGAETVPQSGPAGPIGTLAAAPGGFAFAGTVARGGASAGGALENGASKGATAGGIASGGIDPEGVVRCMASSPGAAQGGAVPGGISFHEAVRGGIVPDGTLAHEAVPGGTMPDGIAADGLAADARAQTRAGGARPHGGRSNEAPSRPQGGAVITAGAVGVAGAFDTAGTFGTADTFGATGTFVAAGAAGTAPAVGGAPFGGPDPAGQAHRRRLHEGLIAALQLRRRDIGGMSDAALRAEAAAVLAGLIAADEALPAGLDRQALARELVDEAVGLGPLEPLLADPGVTEIMVNRHDEIFVERGGRLVRAAASFSGEQAVLGIIDRIVAPLGRRIDESAPMVDARLRDGSRVNAVIAPIALRGASLTIRKFPARRLDMPDLLAVGALDEAMARFLTHCVRHRRNLIVSGGTGSGKTSLLNVLSNAIPAGERIITIEDAAELRLNHAHLVSLEARPPNAEGRGRVEIRDLVRNALRMRPDRIVVGECRGGEAFDMLAAMNTGHEGSLTTLHANSPRDALGRLETMILMAGMDLPLAAIREHIASSIDFIVQLVRAADGRRLVSAIVQVTGQEGGRIQLQELFLGRVGPPAVFTGCGLPPDGFEGAAALDTALFSGRTVIQGRAALDEAPPRNASSGGTPSSDASPGGTPPGDASRRDASSPGGASCRS
nr:ATPase, T2SS/T4P/T4SS family [Castellaniella defragrans]